MWMYGTTYMKNFIKHIEEKSENLKRLIDKDPFSFLNTQVRMKTHPEEFDPEPTCPYGICDGGGIAKDVFDDEEIKRPCLCYEPEDMDDDSDYSPNLNI